MSSAHSVPTSTVSCPAEVYYAVKGIEHITDGGPRWYVRELLGLVGINRLEHLRPFPTRETSGSVLSSLWRAFTSDGYTDEEIVINSDLFLSAEHISRLPVLLASTRYRNVSLDALMEAVRRRTEAVGAVPRLTLAATAEPTTPRVDIFETPPDGPVHEFALPTYEVVAVESDRQHERVFYLEQWWISATPLCKLLGVGDPASAMRKMKRLDIDVVFRKFSAQCDGQPKHMYWCPEETARKLLALPTAKNCDTAGAILRTAFAEVRARAKSELSVVPSDPENERDNDFRDALAEVTDDLTERIAASDKEMRSRTDELRSAVTQLRGDVQDSRRSAGRGLTMSPSAQSALLLSAKNEAKLVAREVIAQHNCEMDSRLDGSVTTESVEAIITARVESRVEEMSDLLRQEFEDQLRAVREGMVASFTSSLVDLMGDDTAAEVESAITLATSSPAELRDRAALAGCNHIETELLTVLSKNGPLTEPELHSRLKGKGKRAMHTTLHTLSQRGVVHRDSSKRWVF